MKKMLLGALVGGIILFIWSFAAWVFLPLHTPHLHGIPNEDAVISSLKSSLDKEAVYIFPHNPGMGADSASMDSWTKKMKRGPAGLIIYTPSGSDPVMPGQMVVGFILDILSAAIVSWFLLRSTALSSSYVARVMYCGMFGIFVSFFTHLMNMNWMGFPLDFTTGLIIDGIVGWILAGLGIAAFVKTKPDNLQP